MKIKTPNQKIKNFRPLHYNDIKESYDATENMIQLLKKDLEEKREVLKYYEIVSTEKKIERLQDILKGLLNRVEAENKKNVYRESINSRLINIMKDHKRDQSLWFKTEDLQKTFKDIYSELKEKDETLFEEIASEFGTEEAKKKIYGAIISQHFLWFGSEENRRWKLKNRL
jgi:hypothetical protein